MRNPQGKPTVASTLTDELIETARVGAAVNDLILPPLDEVTGKDLEWVAWRVVTNLRTQFAQSIEAGRITSLGEVLTILDVLESRYAPAEG